MLFGVIAWFVRKTLLFSLATLPINVIPGSIVFGQDLADNSPIQRRERAI
jgi:hypothetical protein